VKIHTWEVGPPKWESSIYLPLILADEDSCGARFLGLTFGPRWICSRTPGHGGRHAAASGDGMVCAVWGDA